MSKELTRTERIKARYFDEEDHPYRHLERAIEAYIRPEFTVLEAGCGRNAEVLSKYRGKAKRLIGVDPVEFTLADGLEEIELQRGDIGNTGLPSSSVDLVISRALMEHLPKPRPAFAEIQRVLKPGGRYIYLVPNLGDYGSIVALLTPNKLHPAIVKFVEGRKTDDTFPAYFRCCTKSSIQNLCDSTGLTLKSCEYRGQYPAYFQFNSLLFFLATGYEKLISKVDALGFLRGWLLVEIEKPA
ncbi:MAG: SAM-dependent methyltransferase [Planctomycetota bacterium]